MTRSELLQLARDAGFQTGSINMADGSGAYDFIRPHGNDCIPELERFAALIERKLSQQASINKKAP